MSNGRHCTRDMSCDGTARGGVGRSVLMISRTSGIALSRQDTRSFLFPVLARYAGHSSNISPSAEHPRF